MLTTLRQQPAPQPEHPVIGWIAVIAIVVAVLFIAGARIALHGTGDLQAALSDESASRAERPEQASPQRDSKARDEQVEDAVAASRWASAFSH